MRTRPRSHLWARPHLDLHLHLSTSTTCPASQERTRAQAPLPESILSAPTLAIIALKSAKGMWVLYVRWHLNALNRKTLVTLNGHT